MSLAHDLELLDRKLWILDPLQFLRVVTIIFSKHRLVVPDCDIFATGLRDTNAFM